MLSQHFSKSKALLASDLQPEVRVVGGAGHVAMLAHDMCGHVRIDLFLRCKAECCKLSCCDDEMLHF